MTRFLLTAFLLGVLVSNTAVSGAQTAGVTATSAPVTGADAAPAVGARASVTPPPPAASAVAVQRPSLSFGLEEEENSTTAPISLTAGTYGVFHTSDGDIVVRLLPEKAPKTVENFVGLASGKKPWKHPVTMADMQSPLYNGTTIYKTVENALLYGGDPINRGVGEPGHTLPLEVSPDLRFDAPGLLAASLAGSNSSGSRWFFTLRTIPDWSGRYTIFGKIVGGLDVARAISRKPAKRPTVPLDPVLVSSIEVIEIPAGKKTTASYSTEDGKRFVTIEKNFADDAAVAKVATPPAEPATTATAELTTATKVSAPKEEASASAGKKARK